MNHLLEWSESGVDEELTRLNVLELDGTLPYDYLFYSTDIARRNDGRLRAGMLQRYRHLEAGGWWCSGVDLLTGERDLWGCFKPNQPRLSPDRHKPIKYEHPPKTTTGLFALRVPRHIWQAIADRAGIPLTADDLQRADSGFGFWQWLLDRPQVPLLVTEGAKKAGALLSAGYAAVALPGANGGYRVPRDEWGHRIGKSRLIPQLERLARGNRPVYLALDRDKKPATVQAVNAAVRQTGYLLQQAGCAVRVVTWNPDDGKGADDVIAQRGRDAFEFAVQNAPSLAVWKAEALNLLTYSPDVQIDRRYLGDLAIPSCAPLVGIRSPKGTGKTELLAGLVREAIARQQPVLVIGHRVQLVEALCHRFGLPYISHLENPRAIDRGYGLCIDSLHPDSQAQFDPRDWQDAIVIIDEVEQVLWHGLNSDTCRGQRVAILRSLKRLLEVTLGEAGQVLVADADLSDTALDYLLSLSGVRRSPYLICNDWTPGESERWQVQHYSESTPKRFVKELETHIQNGGKPFVCLSAQKLTSSWGTRSLEAYFQQKFPDRRILRIDAESVCDPKHPAYRCTRDLDRHLHQYDIVLASPALETGISIELRGHFTSVWALAQGVQTANSVRQAIARLRDSVPRHLWVASYGFNKVGNGATSIPGLLTSGTRLTQLNVRLLQQADFEALDDLDVGFQAESLLCWAKMGVRLNAAMAQYREAVISALAAEGHAICAVPAAKKRGRSRRKQAPSASDTLHDRIAEVQHQNYQVECQAIARAPDLSLDRYRRLKKCMVKSARDRRSLRKHELHRRYKIPVTVGLVERDDRGWYGKLRLHYFLTVGRSFLAERDRRVAQQLVERGHGQVFQPDFNRSQLGATVGTMHVLGIPTLLDDPNRELCNTDPDLQAMATLALQHRHDIKTTTGIGLAKNSTPIVILRRFLDKIGYSLNCLRCERRVLPESGKAGKSGKSTGKSGSKAGRKSRPKKKAVRIYQIERPQDDRDRVFRNWLSVDRRIPGRSDSEFDLHLDAALTAPPSQHPSPSDGVQLSLDLEGVGDTNANQHADPDGVAPGQS